MPLVETRSELKAQLRKDALARREAMDVAQRIEASMAIADRAMGAWPAGERSVLGGYLPIRSEVDPRPLMAMAADRRVQLAVPAIVGRALDFRMLERDAPLEPQGHGTMAPGEAAPRLKPDILLVPLAAFDRRGHRIGYGGGFYDRAIASLSEGGARPFTIGLAFAVQEIEAVPDEAFDMPLDLIVTEAEAIKADRFS